MGDVRRHKFDCELAAAAAAYSKGPRYGGDTMSSVRGVLRSSDNCYYYGGKAKGGANDRDLVAATKVLKSAYTGSRTVLTPHEAAHVREGAAWLARHKSDLPPGFVKAASGLYAHVYDGSGRKVVDRRSLRM